MKLPTIPSRYEEEIYCHCMDMQTMHWFWVKTEKPHDHEAVEQKLANLGKRDASRGSWYTDEEYLFWSFDDEPLL